MVDADRLARDAVAAGTPGLAQVIEAFGTTVVTADGELDRKALASLVFADERARQRLEEIVHPRVRAMAAERIAEAPDGAVVVYDVPLLVETGMAAEYDLVLVVEAAEPVRLGRLLGRRGMPLDQAVARIRAQATDEQRRAVADEVIVNDTTVEAVCGRVDEIWQNRIEPLLAKSVTERN